MSSYVVVGASRGIGLEFVRQLAAKPGSTVFAIVRSAKTSTHLAATVEGLKNVHVLEGDVVDYPSLERAAKKVADITGGKLDVLIQNAARTDLGAIFKGYNDFPSVEALDADLIDAYKINTLGVIHAIHAFLPLLRASTASLKKVVVINSQAGDPKFVRAIGAGDVVAYGITKAATTLATIKYALKLKDEGFVVVSLYPGTVDTIGTMGLELADAERARAAFEQLVKVFKAAGYYKPLQTPEQSVAAQLKTIDNLTAAHNGRCLEHTGEEWVG